MDKSDIKKASVPDLIKKMTFLQNKILENVEFYNAMCEEICRRYPIPDILENFKPFEINEKKIEKGKERVK